MVSLEDFKALEAQLIDLKTEKYESREREARLTGELEQVREQLGRAESALASSQDGQRVAQLTAQVRALEGAADDHRLQTDAMRTNLQHMFEQNKSLQEELELLKSGAGGDGAGGGGGGGAAGRGAGTGGARRGSEVAADMERLTAKLSEAQVEAFNLRDELEKAQREIVQLKQQRTGRPRPPSMPRPKPKGKPGSPGKPGKGPEAGEGTPDERLLHRLAEKDSELLRMRDVLTELQQKLRESQSSGAGNSAVEAELAQLKETYNATLARMDAETGSHQSTKRQLENAKRSMAEKTALLKQLDEQLTLRGYEVTELKERLTAERQAQAAARAEAERQLEAVKMDHASDLNKVREECDRQTEKLQAALDAAVARRKEVSEQLEQLKREVLDGQVSARGQVEENAKLRAELEERVAELEELQDSISERDVVAKIEAKKRNQLVKELKRQLKAAASRNGELELELQQTRDKVEELKAEHKREKLLSAMIGTSIVVDGAQDGQNGEYGVTANGETLPVGTGPPGTPPSSAPRAELRRSQSNRGSMSAHSSPGLARTRSMHERSQSSMQHSAAMRRGPRPPPMPHPETQPVVARVGPLSMSEAGKEVTEALADKLALAQDRNFQQKQKIQYLQETTRLLTEDVANKRLIIRNLTRRAETGALTLSTGDRSQLTALGRRAHLQWPTMTPPQRRNLFDKMEMVLEETILENQQLRDHKDQLGNEVRRLAAVVDEHAAKGDARSLEVELLQSRVAELEEECGQLIDRLEAELDAKQRLEAERNKLDAELQAVSERMAALQAEQEDNAEAVAVAKMETSQLRDRVAELEGQVEEHGGAVGESQARLAAVEKELAGKEKEVASLKEDVASKAAEVEALQRRVGDLEGQVEEHGGAVGESQARLAAVEKELAGKAKELIEKEKEVASLEEDVASKAAEVDTLQQRVGDLEGQVEEHGGAAGESQAKLAAVEKELAGKEKELAEKAQEVASLEEDVASKAAEVETLQQRVSQLEGQVEEHGGAVGESQAKLAAAEQELANKEKEVASLEEDVASKAAEVESLQQRANQLEGQVEEHGRAASESQAKLAAAEEDLAAKQEQVDTLKQQLQEATAAAQAEAAALKTQLSEAEASTSKVDDLKSQLEAYEAEFEAQSSQLQSATTKTRDLESQLEAYEAEVESLTEQVSTLQAQLADS